MGVYKKIGETSQKRRRGRASGKGAKKEGKIEKKLLFAENFSYLKTSK